LRSLVRRLRRHDVRTTGLRPRGGGAGHCNAESAWRERCKNETCSPTVTVCPTDAPCPSPEPRPCNVSNLICDTPGMDACLERVFRPEALAQMRQCELDLACDGGREHCIENVTLPDSLPSAKEFETACQARVVECVGQTNEPFGCAVFSAMTDEWIALWRACLDEPCGSIRGCQEGGKLDAFCATR